MKNKKKESRNIANYSIFGEYKQTENRVTAALLHILRIGKEELITTVLNRGGWDLPSSDIAVETQFNDKNSIPDGKLSCNFSFQLFIESKININDINIVQLENHKRLIKSDSDKLIYITPDSQCPKELLDEEVIWYNWEQITEILINYDTDNELLQFLIEQFKLLIENLGLLDYTSERVIIVGGSFGEVVALKYNFYACQNRRSFSSAKYLAFAFKHRIKYLFEITEEPEDDVDLKQRSDINPSYFKELDPNYNGLRKLFKLKLLHEFSPQIENNSVDKKGIRCAFVQRQTYTTYDKIMKAKYTSDLL